MMTWWTSRMDGGQPTGLNHSFILIFFLILPQKDSLQRGRMELSLSPGLDKDWT